MTGALFNILNTESLGCGTTAGWYFHCLDIRFAMLSGICVTRLKEERQKQVAHVFERGQTKRAVPGKAQEETKYLEQLLCTI